MIINFVMFLALTTMMMNASQGAHRVPPSWNPMNQDYSYRAYVYDIMQWVLMTDLNPTQQAIAISQRLEGTARELARSIGLEEFINGGTRNGQPVDPVHLLMGCLNDH